MIFLKKHKGMIVSLCIIVAVLVFTYMWGGNTPPEKSSEKNVQSETSTLPAEKKEKVLSGEVFEEKTAAKETALVAENDAGAQKPAVIVPKTVSEPKNENIGYSVLQGIDIDEKTGYETQPVPDGRPVPIEPQTVTISDSQMTCTLTIRCDTLLDNLDYLDAAKRCLVPADGIILAEKQVTFYEGESVFNVLLRETRRNNIHMEYVNTPIYNSAYIEGIHNLYEFDCGELSGWMYSVNGWFPNYGSSRYGLSDGDRIEWIYTCNLGKDVK